VITDLTPIQSYLYQQYAYDNTTQYIQPFFTAYNTQSQTNLDRINNLNLPIYWGLSGALLDWVALSLYGFERPVLPQGNSRTLGLYNTNELNEFQYNEEYVLAPQTFYECTDDIFKRCITWNFFKGDGMQFDIQWLKRRVVRFLLGGANPNIQEHWQISVTFPAEDEVIIHIRQGISSGGEGSLFNTFELDKTPLNTPTQIVNLIPIDLAPILASAINAGVLQLPVGFTYTVVY
jgi:hypothetical protein